MRPEDLKKYLGQSVSYKALGHSQWLKGHVQETDRGIVIIVGGGYYVPPGFVNEIKGQGEQRGKKCPNDGKTLQEYHEVYHGQTFLRCPSCGFIPEGS